MDKKKYSATLDDGFNIFLVKKAKFVGSRCSNLLIFFIYYDKKAI